MIKVPATPEGIIAIRQLISEAINVNVTLLFSQDTYEEVVEAYMAGLEDRVATGADVEGIASVASFFISRIDSLVDERIKRQNLSRNLLGKVAIANARLTYQRYGELFEGPRWNSLSILALKPNGSCGPVRAQRIRNIAMCFTSKNSSAPTR